MNLQEFQQFFADIFDKHLDTKIGSIKQIIQSPQLHHWLDQTKIICMSWWKRIRPYLVYTAYTGYSSQKHEEVMLLSMVTELIHSLAIIFDDVIDLAHQRHNVQTLHEFLKPQTTNVHEAHMQAILISNYFYSRATELLYQNDYFDFITLKRAAKHIHASLDAVMTWQIQDVILQKKTVVDETLCLKKSFLKTASYTCVRPLLFWASLAIDGTKELETLERLGEDLGIAYQCMDDLWDVTGIHKDKQFMADIVEWQQTLLSTYMFCHASDTHRQAYESYFGKNITEEQKQIIKQLLFDAWAIKHARAVTTKYIASARESLQQLTMFDQQKQYIADIIDLVEHKASQ